MTEGVLRICHLYPREMNIYGDCGNVLILEQRMKWRGISSQVISCSVGDDLPSDIDLMIGGGGQDSSQLVVQPDLLSKATRITRLVKEGVPALMVCGMYQLFCSRLVLKNGDILKGLDIFDAETVIRDTRLIGNISCETEAFGTVLGYENHGGHTHLQQGVQPFGNVSVQRGNNGKDKTEGAHWINAIGTYLHGPLLAMNPQIADYLIVKAYEYRYGKAIKLDPLPDIDQTLVKNLRMVAQTRPR